MLQPLLTVGHPLPPGLVKFFFVMNIGGVSALAFFLLFYFVHQKDALMALLRIEEQKSQNLLLNILPGRSPRC